MHDSLTQGDRPGIREDQIPNNGDDRLLDGCHPLASRNHFGFIGVGVTSWINAGHGLTYQNVESVAAIEGMEELNIGHTIISRSIAVGLKDAVKEMKALIQNPRKDLLFEIK